MEMSVREARAQFAHALAAAERGERVTITKNGKPVAEIGPPAAAVNAFSWDRLESWRRTNGLDKLPIDPASDAQWLSDFDALGATDGMMDPIIDPEDQ
ncbi:type II toxin-antitoxin system Phd/YefM family antitoxin [Sphingomonas radiodurans]|uniref:type II toxin-antitoxin system Phd/YefM family antitoxin n=1 Tax=Sphingomonas radiodurans TaxID=2890321 RepID=UPI001E2B515D|nr:type II toxin-antitoxin system prevent-host-death family antitoxin [Sphingomonas radiodurans]WBH17356.1 type II toxin-antitoxin system prevent-host-death family antitoxin [Sphingomonas radiodurans]